MQSFMSRLLASFKKSSKRGVSTKRDRRVRLQLEGLEDRQLLSASPALALSASMNTTTTTVDYIIKDINQHATWPTNPGFFIEIGTEVMKVTGDVLVDAYEVQRDSNGVDTAHNAGDAIFLVPAPTLQQPPATPTNFTAKAVSTSEIDLAWTAVAGDTSYVIYAYNGTSTPTQIDTTTGTSFAVNQGLQPGTPYSFEVAAQNNGGIGQPTGWQTATTFALPTLPPPPQNFTAQAVSSSQVNLAWSGVTGATDYVVYQYINSTWQPIASTTSTTYAVGNLNPGTIYYFDVASHNAVGTSAGRRGNRQPRSASYRPPDRRPCRPR